MSKAAYGSIAVSLALAASIVGFVLKPRAVDAQQPNPPAPKEKPGDADGEKKANAETPPPNAALEALVKAANFPYTRMANGSLEIIARSDDDPMLVIAMEEGCYSNQDKSEEVRIAAISLKVVALAPETAAKPPLPLIMHLNEVNNKFNPGKFVIASGGGTTPGIYFESAFWLATATPQTIRWELTNAFLRRAVSRKEMEPFLKDAKEAAVPAKD
jgi:hypothetical protein